MYTIALDTVAFGMLYYEYLMIPIPFRLSFIRKTHQKYQHQYYRFRI